MDIIVFEVRDHYYSIDKGIDIYPNKLGMIDVRIFDSNKNKEVAVVAFNENIPKGNIFWSVSYNDIDYYIKITNNSEKIKELAYNYLKSLDLSYD